MQKKEINEIKGLFKNIENCGISRLAGCYVSTDGKKVSTFNERFLDLPEEEIYKYFEIFRKTFSGTQGKNLLDMEFCEEGGGEILHSVLSSNLQSENVLNRFYDAVIENYKTDGNYLILLVTQDYDVPGITTDGMNMEDASDIVYSYILCSICPVDLTKPGLGYDEGKSEFHTIQRFFAVDLPETGFLYPAFTDREGDDSQLLYYSKNADKAQRALIDNLLQCQVPMPAKKQAESFKGLVTEVLGNESTFNQVKTLQDEIHNYLQEKKDALSGESGALTIKKEDIKEILGKSGVSSEKLENFDESFENHFGRKVDLTTGEIIGEEEVPFDEDDETLNADILSADSGDDGKETREEAGEVSEEHPTKDAYNDKRIFAENLIPSKKFEVKTADVIVRINSDKTDLVFR